MPLEESCARKDRAQIADALDGAAKRFEREAARLRKHAAQERINLRKLHAHLARVNAIPAAHKAAVAARVNDPTGHVADQLGTLLETVAVHLAMIDRGKAAQARKRRNREMIRLARLGLTNAQIAAQFGVHRNTVQRIVAGGFRTNTTS